MNTYDPPAGGRTTGSPRDTDPNFSPDNLTGPAEPRQESSLRVGTVVWGLIVVALAALIIISQLGIVTLNGTYVLIGLMIGAGAALVIGGLLSARRSDKPSPARKA